jgi:hypothetical protein
MTVYWTHTSGSGDASGVLSFRVSSGGNGDAISAGGYAGIHSTGSNSETNGASMQGLLPMVGVFPVRNSEEDDWDMVVAFAVPIGSSAEAHLWVVTA